MDTCTTRDIKVSVEVFYQPFQSRPQAGQYVFAYRVHIENLGEHTVQLLRRHWIIVDSNGNQREVKGVGVIGKMPVLEPGEVHTYESWCPLQTSIGKMYGSFQMQLTGSSETFDVQIPEFRLIAPFREN